MRLTGQMMNGFVCGLCCALGLGLLTACEAEPDGDAPLAPEDLRDVVGAGVETLIVGTGGYGVMKVPDDTVTFLESRGVKVEAYDTPQAVRRYNELAAAGKAVAAALHLTC